MTAIERLQTWKAGHQHRSLSISADSKFGKTGWDVMLIGEKMSWDATKSLSTMITVNESDMMALQVAIHKAIDSWEQASAPMSVEQINEMEKQSCRTETRAATVRSSDPRHLLL